MSAPAAAKDSVGGLLQARASVLVFLVFSLGYFSSAMVRAVTATLSPVLTSF